MARIRSAGRGISEGVSWRRAWERPPYSTSRGQALIVAVLVLFAVATLAALFTAIISSQVAQTGRHADVVQLRNVAEAGLRWANEQLSYGIDGADWRPSQKVYRTGGGEVTIDVSYGPIPTQRPQLQSRFIRIVASAVFPDNPFLRYTLLAWKPLLLTDYARFITDRYETNEPASLGVAGVELGGKPREAGNGAPYVFQVTGPIRSNTDLAFYGTSQISLFTRDYPEMSATWNQLGILRDDTIEVSGEMFSKDSDPATGTSPSRNVSRLSLYINNQLRTDDLFNVRSANPTNADMTDYQNGYADAWRSDGTPVPNTWRVLANLPDYPPDPVPVGTTQLRPYYLAPPRIRPPLIDSTHPDLQTNRYLALTRDSGDWLPSVSQTWLTNTGQYGWGWMNGSGGIYIDNTADIQYRRLDGTHDLAKLRRNWVGSVGVHQMTPATASHNGDKRDYNTAKDPPDGPADWWDKTGRYYSPPGVEIILHGDADCPWIEIIRDDAKPTDPKVPIDWANLSTYFYWQKPQGSAIAGANPYDARTGRCSPPLMNPGPSVIDNGQGNGQSKNRAVMPFPPNGVLYAEGNIRIRGIMPPARYEPTTYLDLDQYSPSKGAPRKFDLQVVSGGTIYVEGDLLTPGPEGAKLRRFNKYGNTDQMVTLDLDRQWGSRVALLARDYVCLNTTALFPRPVDMFQTRTKTVDSTTTEYWYNDLQPVYPKDQPDKQYAYMHFQGPTDATLNSDAGAATWDRQPMATKPASVDLVYRNLRFRLPDVERRPEDLRLMLGHSAWYLKDDTTEPMQPPEKDSNGTNEASVDVQVSAGPAPTALQVLNWVGQGTDRYTFWRQTLADPVNKDESDHWYTTNDQVELLPNQYQAMGVPLTGEDFINLSMRVLPIGIIDPDTGAVTSWRVKPRELGYILGPLAIAPPRWVTNSDGTPDVGNPKIPMTVDVQALIYAQNGSWFIIPGPWFNEDASYATNHPNWDTEYPGYHEPLNIQLQFFGAISENMPAPIGDVADWTSKWSGTKQFAETYGNTALRYFYDPLLRVTRVRRDAYNPDVLVTTPRFPRMPLTPDLVVWGERISGQAGG